MRRIRVAVQIVLCGLGIVFTQAVFAEGANMIFYAGGGESELESSWLNEGETGFKIATGFRASEYSGIEVSFISLGDMDVDAFIGATPIDASFDVRTIVFQYIRYVPVMNVADVFAKVGYGSWRSKLSAKGITSITDSGEEFVIGAGVGVNVNKLLGFRFEWEQSEVEDVDVNFVSAGIVFNIE